jgi:hypothetical protein
MANIKINNLQAANLNSSTSELFNELTEAEILDIHGGWWFAPVIGYTALGAGLGAYHSYRTTGSINWRDVGAGATTGFYASPIGRVLGPTRTLVMGSLGVTSWYIR